jgi:beta-glucosidase
VFAVIGHLLGTHAPGMQDPFQTAAVIHHLLLSHGLAVSGLRESAGRPIQVGISLNLTTVHPASSSEVDLQAAKRYDGFSNRMVLDPLIRGRYPEEIFAAIGGLFTEIRPDDMDIISTPMDFIGVNYYSRDVIVHDENVPVIQASAHHPPESEYSQMWEIFPAGMYEILVRVWKEYGQENIFITENGAPVPDGLDFDGKVRDYRRIRYLGDHLIQAHQALQAGAPIKGYFVWSLLDNFEWALGYRTRFGLVYVDFDSGKRTIKESGWWYRDVITRNGFDTNGLGC